MTQKQKFVKRILLALLFAALFVPFLQEQFNFTKLSPLNGSFQSIAKPKFNWDKWFKGDFQNLYTKYSEENIGFRNFLIRLFNQIDFSLFDVTHEAVVVGKQGYLFQEYYINAYLGKDFIGKDKIAEQSKKIKFVKEKLNEKGIELIIAFAPNKARFFPEYLPDFYANQEKVKTNYETYKEFFKKDNIPCLDLIDYFQKTKEISKYPLYPKQGIHWSEYGMYLVADSLIRYIEKTKNLNLNTVYCDNIEMPDTLRGTDYDLGKLSNLLFTLPHYKMAYPQLRFENNPVKTRPKVLTVGDSYFWNIFYSNIPRNIFSGANFWYYNHEIHTDSLPRIETVDPTTSIREVEKQDVIILLQSESNLDRLGFGFIENLYEEYNGSLDIDSISFDLENTNGLQSVSTITDKEAHSGKKSSELNKKNEFSVIYSIPIQKLDSTKMFSKVAYSFYLKSNQRLNDAMVVLSVTDKEKTLEWLYDELRTKPDDAGKWIKKSFEFHIKPADYKEGKSMLNIYVWNVKNEEFFIDDLKINYYSSK